MIQQEGYVRWFVLEATLNGLAGLLEFITCAVLSGAAILVAFLIRRGAIVGVWGASVRFRDGLRWALGAGICLGLVDMFVIRNHG